MQKLLLPLAATALLAVSFSQPARADEAAVRKAIESYGNTIGSRVHACYKLRFFRFSAQVCFCFFYFSIRIIYRWQIGFAVSPLA